MSSYYEQFLESQAWFRVLVALLPDPEDSNPQGRVLREVADLTGLSPAGAHDVVRRLLAARLISGKKVRGRIRYLAVLEPAECAELQRVADAVRIQRIRARARRYGREAKRRVEWIDEMCNALIAARRLPT